LDTLAGIHGSFFGLVVVTLVYITREIVPKNN